MIVLLRIYVNFSYIPFLGGFLKNNNFLKLPYKWCFEHQVMQREEILCSPMAEGTEGEKGLNSLFMPLYS